MIKWTSRKSELCGLSAISTTTVVLWLAWLSLAFAPAAHAAQQVIGAKGIISSSTFPLPTDAPLGTTVVLQLTYDDAVTDDFPGNPAIGEYSNVMMNASIAILGTNALHQGQSTTSTARIIVRNDDFSGVSFTDQFQFHAAPGMMLLGLDVQIASLSLQLEESALSPPTTVTSDAVPMAPFPLLADFSSGRNIFLQTFDLSTFVFNDIQITVVEFDQGGSLTTPIIPNSVVTNPDGTITFTFGNNGVTLFPPRCQVPGFGCWYDPPLSPAFTYAMTNSALFTGITDFPTGFNADFDVSVGGTSLGLFGPGDSVDFTGFPGGGVAEFVVSGIDPLADLSDVEAFPLALSVDSLDATFTMTSSPSGVAVPALGSWSAFLALVLLGAGYSARRRVQLAQD